MGGRLAGPTISEHWRGSAPTRIDALAVAVGGTVLYEFINRLIYSSVA
jgi:hypothetical protein